MEVTNIRLKRVDNNSKLKAWASITFDDSFVVHNIKVIQGQDSMFIAMPNRLTRTGVFKDIAHPITSEFREMLQNKVLDAYRNTTANDSSESSEWDE
jgi:stage V sporulation protein G